MGAKHGHLDMHIQISRLGNAAIVAAGVPARLASTAYLQLRPLAKELMVAAKKALTGQQVQCMHAPCAGATFRYFRMQPGRLPMDAHRAEPKAGQTSHGLPPTASPIRYDAVLALITAPP